MAALMQRMSVAAAAASGSATRMGTSNCGRRCLHGSSSVASSSSADEDRGAAISTKERSRDLNRIVSDEKKGVFRVLDIGKPKLQSFTNTKKPAYKWTVNAPPRERLMKPDQDWTSVWPAGRTFHPAVVPLPIRQGMRVTPETPTPDKWANAELMKVPNFLHLTPPTIKKHCDQLKQFCTEFPQELKNEDEMELNLPLTEITSDYLNASSSIRDNRSRIVTLQFRLSELRLDAHARDKFMRLVGEERYDYTTDKVTITSDRLPHRKQNRDYCEYLIKALYFESNKTEEWESEREEIDEHMFKLPEQQPGDSPDLKQQDEREYMESLQKLFNEGEDHRTVDNYKSKVQKMLGLTNDIPVAAEREA